jgi:hypothetical protein
MADEASVMAVTTSKPPRRVRRPKVSTRHASRTPKAANGHGRPFEIKGKPGWFANLPQGAGSHKRARFKSREEALSALDALRAVDAPIDLLRQDFADWMVAWAWSRVGIEGPAEATKVAAKRKGKIGVYEFKNYESAARRIQRAMPLPSDRTILRFGTRSHAALLRSLFEKECQRKGQGWYSANMSLDRISRTFDLGLLTLDEPPFNVNPFKNLRELEPPVCFVQPPKPGKFFDLDHIAALAEYLRGTRMWPEVLLMLLGLRPSEMAGTLVGHLDRTSGLLLLRESYKLQRRAVQEGDGIVWAQGPLKNNPSIRDIILPADALWVVDARLRLREAILGRPLEPTDQLMVNSIGTPWKVAHLHTALLKELQQEGCPFKWTPSSGRDNFHQIALESQVFMDERCVWTGHGSASAVENVNFWRKASPASSVDGIYLNLLVKGERIVPANLLRKIRDSISPAFERLNEGWTEDVLARALRRAALPPTVRSLACRACGEPFPRVRRSNAKARVALCDDCRKLQRNAGMRQARAARRALVPAVGAEAA